jgi:MFS family permease
MIGQQGPGIVFGFIIGGVIVGQFGLLATWAVLGPWRLYSQWFVALLVGLGLFLAFMGGIVMVDPPRSFRQEFSPIFLQMILGMMAFLVAAQVPLWCIRLLRGWRLVLRGTDTAQTAIESRQLQVRDILIVMTILAVYLGTASAVSKEHSMLTSSDFLIVILMYSVIGAIWSAMVLPICLWACFGASTIGARIVVLVTYAFSLAVIFAGLAVASSGGSQSPVERFFFFAVLHAALLATLFSGLGLARACGYEMVSIRTARRQALPASGSPFGPSEETPDNASDT